MTAAGHKIKAPTTAQRKPDQTKPEMPSLTNPNKVLYPAVGFTKRQVVEYYEFIAPWMLPHVRGRPVSLKRLPDGIGGLEFFEKRAPEKRPTWVHTAHVASTRHGSLTYVVVDNPETLLWLANRAALEIHLFLFQNGHEEHPETLIFDLDPGAPAGLAACIPVALAIRDLLADLGLRTFVKSSGSKGLHLLVPLGRTATFSQTKDFANTLAQAFENRFPRTITATMAKASRGGKVFIDWSQNDHGKTTVAAYSLRAREHPTVSAPLTWDEVATAGRRGKAERLVFEAGDMRPRIAAEGDLLAEAIGLRQRLPSFPSSLGTRTA